MDVKKIRVAVIGGGIVGLATALQLQKKGFEKVLLFEKEKAVGQHQSGNNSGVLHAGLYYKPGSSKARLAVRGIRLMKDFCAENGFLHEVCGKIVVATEPEEIPRLHTLFERGNQNGLSGLKMLGAEEIREREPKACGLEAVLVPEEGIVDYPAVMRAMAAKISAAGGAIHLGSGVRKMTRAGKAWEIETASGPFSADFVVGCAGLHADRVSRMAGENPDAKIVPFRGEYFKLKKDREHLVRHLIYPVPDPRIPFLGVHFTRLAVGGVEAGPNAVLAFAREGYKKSDLNLRDLAGSLSFPGLWRFIKKYPGTTFDEVKRSLFKSVFCRSLQRLVPEVQLEDLEPGGAGVRAQLMSREGELVQDFYLMDGPGSLHVLNAPSPAATASLAIGGEIASRVGALVRR